MSRVRAAVRLVARALVLVTVLATSSPAAEPISIGHTFTLESAVLGETRRVNVFEPTVYGDSIRAPWPVLVMPDGGVAEDFLHVAGLLQVLVSNGGMRPFLLVGIENTQRRRDTTGPTDDPEDRKIAPQVGGSAAFRRFVRTELLPAIAARYPTTGERAVVGESLAGLFVIETLFREPDLFDTYLAFDPSLWWNRSELLERAPLPATGGRPKTVVLVSSSQKELARTAAGMAKKLGRAPGVRASYLAMPGETHATIYHAAALAAFRSALRPPAAR